MIDLVSPPTDELLEPITPAIACGPLLSDITGISVDKIYSLPSSVLIFSPFLANLTSKAPLSLSLSNTCIGCPISNIT